MIRYIFLLTIIVGLYAQDKVLIQGGRYTIPLYDTIYVTIPSKTIAVDSFMIDKYEVSNIEFGKHNILDDEENYPVSKISYEEAENFCISKGGALPTQEQWIVASSFENGKFFPYPTKVYPIEDENNINIKDERAIELEDGGYGAEIDLVDVDQAIVGINGIVGMLGNVWEITKTDGSYVVLKGGSFYNNSSKELLNNLVENRVLKFRLKDYEHIGFRCVYKK